MEDLSIKIKIANRDYPMKVSPQNEGQIRMAGKKLNEKLTLYSRRFGIDNNQDLLAVVAFDLYVDALNKKEHFQEIDKTLFDKLDHMSDLISQTL